MNGMARCLSWQLPGTRCAFLTSKDGFSDVGFALGFCVLFMPIRVSGMHVDSIRKGLLRHDVYLREEREIQNSVSLGAVEEVYFVTVLD